MSRPRAVVLLSGGLDSSTTLYRAKADGFAPCALSVDYGQRHRRELDAARAVARAAGVGDHVVVALDLRAIGGSALTDALDVPKDRDEAMMAGAIPPTYVPARNTVLLGLALGLAETRGAFDLYLGVNALDYSGYPDCRPEFVSAFEALANLATKAGVEGAGRYRVHAPLLRMSKRAIVEDAVALGVPLALTWSCYDPTPVDPHAGAPSAATSRPCGRCDSCRLRAKGFAEAGREDPALSGETP